MNRESIIIKITSPNHLSPNALLIWFGDIREINDNISNAGEPGRYQELDLFIKVLRLLCPNLTDASYHWSSVCQRLCWLATSLWMSW